jgi:molybdenum cofactor cytidylyltransferase
MISAIVLAAGESKRMGQPKMLMPWGESTVLQTVIATLQAAGVTEIHVVTGGARRQVEALVGRSVQTIFNEDYANGEMLGSIQTALKVQLPEATATLICLGDQPQLREGSVQKVCETFVNSHASIVVPSYSMHRGHPWLVARPLWGELMEMKAPLSARDFLKKYSDQIKYVEIDTATILEDLDTPEDYLKSRS